MEWNKTESNFEVLLKLNNWKFTWFFLSFNFTIRLNILRVRDGLVIKVNIFFNKIVLTAVWTDELIPTAWELIFISEWLEYGLMVRRSQIFRTSRLETLPRSQFFRERCETWCVRPTRPSFAKRPDASCLHKSN